jgi:hypothetical protein
MPRCGGRVFARATASLHERYGARLLYCRVRVVATGVVAAGSAVRCHAVPGRPGIEMIRAQQNSPGSGGTAMPHWFVPTDAGIGAVVGAGSELATELGVIDANVDKIAARCLHDKGLKTGTYLVIDPNL